MRRAWILGGGVATVALSLVLVAGLVGVDDPGNTPPGQPATGPTESPVAEAAVQDVPLRLVPLELDPAHDWLTERSLELVSEYLGSAATDGLLARWHEASIQEARLIFASVGGERFITLGAARADCGEVDAFLNEVGDPFFGVPGLCERWISTTRKLLRERGIERTPRSFLRQQNIDTSVRVALVYAGWKRTGRGPQDFRLVASRGVPVYPQSEFSVARRLALDRVMRDLGVGPYSDTPIQLVTALLHW